MLLFDVFILIFFAENMRHCPVPEKWIQMLIRTYPLNDLGVFEEVLLDIAFYLQAAEILPENFLCQIEQYILRV